MSLVCRQCSRVNPEEAAYCYYDGAALAGRAGGPIHAGSAPFPNQFVFPNGTACRNFDQLAMACQQNWPAAIDLLKQGFLGSFFGGMGRIDLAAAAQEAALFPDIERGLDQLIAKLPTQAVQAPQLQAEPSEVNLGQIKLNENRATELHLTNLGMRLLYGNVTSDCKWLTVGEAPGNPEKLFQFGSDLVIPIQVRGQHLRAGLKPLEGHLVIDSNGGTATVSFKADVPITPYPGSLFDGAATPRKVAEKAKANPKDAAPFFENGDVAKWYAANGWPYPVQGPIMSGMGAIEQFFEALGVAKAPKVDFSQHRIDLESAVGKTVETTIEVSTAERKVVYGWATCDQPWVEIGKTRLSGKNALIPVTIRVPSPCPPTLQATLTVVGNGNQKLAVPLVVKVAGGKAGVALQAAEEIYESLEIVEEEIAAPAPIPAAAFAPAAPFAITEAPVPAAVGPAAELSPFAITDAPAFASGSPTIIPKPQRGMSLPVLFALNLAPIVMLGFCLLVPLIHDIFFAAAGANGDNLDAADIDPRPFIKIMFDEGHIGQNYTDSMMFAVHQIDPTGSLPPKKLNYYANGFGNSTVLKIDGDDRAFGFAPDHGKWATGFERGKDVYSPYFKGVVIGKTRTFEFSKGIIVTQTVTIVPSDPVEIARDEYKRLLNTCLVRYTIENRDSTKKTHSVGLRVLMDTCIGDRDDAPFTFPGLPEIVSTKREFKDPKPKVPDFVQVLEKERVRDPGTVVLLGLHVSEKFEAPNRFQLTRYPVSGNPDKRILNKWEVPLEDMKDDSSIVMYWDPKVLAYGKKREIGFTYGLGSVTGDDKLGISVGGVPHPQGELTVLGLVADRDAKFATLKLPPGLKLIAGELKQKLEPIRPGPDGKLRPSQVTWHVRAERTGPQDLSVTLDTRVSQRRRVTITTKSLFN